MFAFNRVNKLGFQYHLTEMSDGQVSIRMSDKSLIVRADIHELNQAWYYWMNGAFIQDAFHMLSDAEREFLMSGLLPAEFDEIFKEKEDADDQA